MNLKYNYSSLGWKRHGMAPYVCESFNLVSVVRKFSMNKQYDMTTKKMSVTLTQGHPLDLVITWNWYMYTIFFFFNFYCYSITVVCLFSPSLHITPAEPTSLPHLHPPPWFCPCVLHSSSWKPFSPLSLTPSLTLI